MLSPSIPLKQQDVADVVVVACAGNWEDELDIVAGMAPPIIPPFIEEGVR